jgi:predicted nuclease of predicted toxin-antitoxin system
MRVLLDENIPRKLRQLFETGVEVATVGYLGWKGKKNGELLRIAQNEFDAFITMDKGIPHQQNLSNLKIGIVLLKARSNRYEDLASLMNQVNVVLKTLKNGQIVRVSA